MIFTTITIPSADDRPISADASVLDHTEDTLAVQRTICLDDNEFMYRALHVPSGSLVTKYAFSDPELAADALIAFWDRLSPTERRIVKRCDVDAMNTRSIWEAFRDTFKAGANIEVVQGEVDCG